MTSPHDRPSAAELLESIREWLERDVLASVEGRLQFHTRVAINSLNIVVRELEMGQGQEVQHRRVLDDLGKSSDAELAQAIRNGEYDNQLPDLLRALAPVIEDKVRVANPQYLR
jgi:hypothetical protein